MFGTRGDIRLFREPLRTNERIHSRSVGHGLLQRHGTAVTRAPGITAPSSCDGEGAVPKAA